MWLDLGEYHGPSHFHAFVRYCTERTRQRATLLSYRTYVTDSMQAAAQGKYLTQRWADVIKPRVDFDADDIIRHVMARVSEE